MRADRRTHLRAGLIGMALLIGGPLTGSALATPGENNGARHGQPYAGDYRCHPAEHRSNTMSIKNSPSDCEILP